MATVIRKLQVKKTREAVSRALAEDQANTELGLSPDLIWLFKVVGAIALLKNPRDSSDGKSPWMQEAGDPQASQAELTAYYLHVAEALRDVTKGMDARPLQDSLVHLVSQNRRAGMALFSSVAATKSDAARRLFEIDGSGITWAVIDSGIDARHPAFRNFKTTRSGKVRPITLPKNGDWNDLTRISATYDFNIIRHVLSKNPGDDPKVPPHVKAKLTRDAGRAKSLRKSLESGRDIDWSLVMPLVQVMHDESYEPPSSLLDHGTHVAGILGADWRDEQNKDLQHGVMQGICPDIRMVMVSHMDDDHINGILQMTSQLADLDEKKRRCHLTW